MKRVIPLLTLVFLIFTNVHGQKKLSTIHNLKAYRQVPDSQKLILLTDSIPDLKLNLAYATTQNFTHTKLYPQPKLFVALPMAKALKEAANLLRPKGFGLLIFDGYRPYSISKKMWEIVQDDRYVANPIHGSDHNRGAAIDISLYNLNTGKPLIMPTSFDDFTENAHLSYIPDSKVVKQNRDLLQSTMNAVGLKSLKTEWWHFYLPNSKVFPILDLEFSQL